MNPALQVFVYREGLLARFGHDLRVSVRRFDVSLQAGRVTGTFEVASARVDGAADGDRVDPTRLSEADRRTIGAAISGEILGACPRVSLDGELDLSDSNNPFVRARVTMNRRTADERLPLSRTPGFLRVNAVLTPSRWGIGPYRTLGGAIRLQDRWRIQLYLPWEHELAALGAAHRTWTSSG